MGWRIPAASVVALQYFAAWMIGSSVGFVYPMPIHGLATIGLCFLVIVLGLHALARLYHLRGEERLLPALRAEIAGAADFPILVFLACAQFAVLGWLKAMMPHAVGFWADPALADLDALIFGTDPWKLMHPAPRWFSWLMDWAYLTWMGVMVLMLSALGLAGERNERAILSFFLIVSICALSQYLLPSAGPIFYEAVGHGTRFADLPTQPWVARIYGHLWDAYTTQVRVGSGISAMPSLHVAGAAWAALALGHFSRPAGYLLWAYFLLILLGSVYLGWHYAVDGLAGLGISLIAWRFAAVRLARPASETAQLA